MNFKNPTPVAVCIIPVRVQPDIALMTIVRNNEPAKGYLAFPGGYLEEGESAQQAAARELLEETGMRSNAEDWQLVDSKTNDKNRILLFCQFHRVLPYAEYAELARRGGHDPREVAGFALITEEQGISPGTVRNHLGFPLHVQAAQDFYRRQRTAKQRALSASRDVLERLADRGDIDSQTQEEMLGELAQLIAART